MATPRKKKKKKSNVFKVVRTVILSLILICIMTGAICGMAFAWYISAYIDPDFDLDIDSLGMNFTSIIYAKDSETGEYVEYQKLHGSENRIWADFEEIPDHLKNAFIAIEDQRFYSHNGVDWKRTLGAVSDWVTGRGTYGGSTITQQLIKNATQDNDYSVKRKLTEIFRALELEKRTNNKDKILEMYMNTIYMGSQAYGVRTAAKTYFNKELETLNLAECAALAGITNNPSRYNPYRYPENTKSRQMIILEEMAKQKLITESQKNEALAYELVYERPEDEGDNADPYNYFTDAVYRDVINDLMEQKNYSRQLANALVTSGGLQIYATVDTNIQTIMESVYADDSNFPNISRNGVLPESAMVVCKPNGEIVGIVGGRGEKEESLGLNRATQSKRQPGSSIKPIAVYAPAIDAGIITPYTGVVDEPYQILNGTEWPRNDDRQYRGQITIKTAVARSINTIAVKTMAQLTPQASYDFMTERLGIDSLVDRHESSNGSIQTDIALAPLALGGLTNGLTVREMAGAYAPFVNDGMFVPTRTYTKVLDADGNVLLTNEEIEPTYAYDNIKTTYYMNELLQGVVTSGTATSAKISGMDTAGKTGTTTANRDRWFCGYTPYYVGATWFGYDQSYSLSGVSGNPATNLWKKVMTQIHEGLPNASFPAKGEGFASASYCSITGLQPGDNCPVEYGRFYKGDAPSMRCPGHASEEEEDELGEGEGEDDLTDPEGPQDPEGGGDENGGAGNEGGGSSGGNTGGGSGNTGGGSGNEGGGTTDPGSGGSGGDGGGTVTPPVTPDPTPPPDTTEVISPDDPES